MEDSRYASRKFILAAFVLVVSVPLLVHKMIDPSQWVTIVGSTLGLYFAANVLQKSVGTKPV